MHEWEVEGTFRLKYFKDLEGLGLVAASRKIGRATLYRVNLGNPMVRMLIEYERQLSLQVAEEEKAKIQRPVPASARPPS